jgi:hypothetical protein
MTILELENTVATTVATTDRWTSGPSLTDQENPFTRRLTLDTVESYLSELETTAIERNAEFYATVVERIAIPEPRTVGSDDVLAD